MTLLYNHSLKPFNTLAVDVQAESFCTVTSVDELKNALKQTTSNELLVLGGGSNIVLTSDVEGLVIHNCIGGVQVLEQGPQQVVIKVGAGENWDGLVETCVQQGWYGLENLSWIPGSVGAAPIQNIGAYGVELKDCLEAVETLRLKDLSPQQFSCKECRFGYRDSVFKQEEKGRHVITAVVLRLNKTPTLKLDYGEIRNSADEWGYDVDQLTAADVRHIIIRIRTEKLPDPALAPNVGSFFKNPVVPVAVFQTIKMAEPSVVAYELPNGQVKLAAGWLIDRLGWKGKRLGQARVHDRQALVLVNEGQSSADLLTLAAKIQQQVLDRFGVELEIEPSII